MAKIVSRGDPIEPVYLNNLRVAAHGWGVISGLVVSEKGSGANMSVDVSTGNVKINTIISKTSVTNVAITAAHASYDRYDLVVINTSGTISVIDGTAAATSYANDYDLEANHAILLAEVYVPATYTTIQDAQITDMRSINTDIMTPYPYLEEYFNHFFGSDNYIALNTSGNGSASVDSSNHEIDISSGDTGNGYGNFISVSSMTLATEPIDINSVFFNLVTGAGTKDIFIGLKNSFSATTLNNSCIFHYDSGASTWRAVTAHASNIDTDTITSPVEGDILAIVATSASVKYYVNGTLVATHTSYIPTVALYLGVSALAGISTGTATSISIDLISLRKHA